MGIFFIIVSVVLFLMQFTIGAWFMKCYPAMGVKGPLLMSLLCTAMVLLGFVYTRTHQTGIFSSVLYYVAYTWFGMVFLAFCICAGLAVVCKILTWCHVSTGWMGPATFIILAVVFVMALWGGFSSPNVKHLSVQIPGAPSMKLALLADTHLGMGVSLSRFDKVLQKIEAEKPDALLVLGDIFEYGPNRDAYAERLAQVKTPLGAYGVLGNHEYYVGYRDSKQFLQQAGVKVLENTSAVMPNGVQVAGLKDIRTAGVRVQDVANVLAPLERNKPTLLLSHTPLYAEAAAAHGANLMLSGHTHNGQLWPFTYLVKMQFPRIYGMYDINGMPFYITSGVFYWGIPLRFLAPAEIVILEVHS